MLFKNFNLQEDMEFIYKNLIDNFTDEDLYLIYKSSNWSKLDEFFCNLLKEKNYYFLNDHESFWYIHFRLIKLGDLNYFKNLKENNLYNDSNNLFLFNKDVLFEYLIKKNNNKMLNKIYKTASILQELKNYWAKDFYNNRMNAYFNT